MEKEKKFIAKASHFTATITRKKREDMRAPEERKKFRGGTDTIISTRRHKYKGVLKWN